MQSLQTVLQTMWLTQFILFIENSASVKWPLKPKLIPDTLPSVLVYTPQEERDTVRVKCLNAKILARSRNGPVYPTGVQQAGRQQITSLSRVQCQLRFRKKSFNRGFCNNLSGDPVTFYYQSFCFVLFCFSLFSPFFFVFGFYILFVFVYTATITTK